MLLSITTHNFRGFAHDEQAFKSRRCIQCNKRSGEGLQYPLKKCFYSKREIKSDTFQQTQINGLCN